MAVKYAPLETFLTTVSPTGPQSEVPLEKINDPGESARGVVLTILAKEAPLSKDLLLPRSELGAELYERTLRELTERQYILQDDNGYSLTAAGREAAELQRSRLMNLW